MDQTIDNSQKKSITYFEDLSNEIIFEIFQFVDFSHVYNAFSNLNNRFHNLLTNPLVPIILNLSSVSKSIFHRYNTNIIIPYRHRIKSLHVSNSFINALIFSSTPTVLKFTQLEKLVLQNIESNYLEKLLIQFTALPCLTSLVIYCEKYVQNKNNLYLKIFSLSKLKYCKLSFVEYEKSEALPITTNEFSPIEYLIINNDVYVYELNGLLSYVPYLRHLSIQCRSRSFQSEKKLNPMVFKTLTHVSLNTIDVPFDEIESIIKNLFHYVQDLYISTNDGRAYLDAKLWEELVLFYIPYLRIFDIYHPNSIYVGKPNTHLKCDEIIEQFRSSFWIERQWFFAYNIKQTHDNIDVTFFSADPYRRRHYLLDEIIIERTCPYNEKTNMDSVHHVAIPDERQAVNCVKYFPNATKLQLLSVMNNQYFLPTTLSRILCLPKLTKLIIDDYYCTSDEITKLLNSMPNICTLILASISISKEYLSVIEENETFQLVSTTNNIINLTINRISTSDEIKFLVKLCPRMQILTIIKCERDVIPLLRFLLSETNRNTRHLFSLSITDAPECQMEKLKTFIDSEKLLNEYFIKVSNDHSTKIHLWW